MSQVALDDPKAKPPRTRLLPARLQARTWHVAGMVALTFALAFAFLGLRGIWDPDEGRYTNVALTMLDDGNWLEPKRNLEVGHWTKPPMTYWLLAGSMKALGPSPWSARLPIALSYLACTLLTALCARRLVPGRAAMAALVYATMLLPHVAGQLVTTDFPLAAFQALAMYGFIEYRFGSSPRPGAWLMVMWLGFAAAFMTKGPPALTALVVVAVMGLWSPGPRVPMAWHAGGVTLFLLLALPWFAIVSLRNPGLLQYFLGAELVDRVASNRFGRHGEWYGWIKIYLPTLLLGTLPWTADLARAVRGLPAGMRLGRRELAQPAQAPRLLLALWILLPLLAFCVARSRMPLYLLPLFAPMAMVVVAQRTAVARGLPRWPWLATWVLMLVCIRVAAGFWPTHKDAAEWAAAIRSRAPGPVHEVVFVEDMARYGLHLYLDAEIEKISREPLSQPRFNPEYDEPLMQELTELRTEPGTIFVAKIDPWPQLARAIDGRGYRARALGAPYRGRVIFEVLPPDGESPAQGVRPAP